MSFVYLSIRKFFRKVNRHNRVVWVACCIVIVGPPIFTACSGDSKASTSLTESQNQSLSTAAESLASSQTKPSDVKAVGPDCVKLPTSGPGSAAQVANSKFGPAVASNPLLKDLLAALLASDLASTMSSSGSYTVFAPTDEAFETYSKDKLKVLFADKERTTEILLNHVIEGEKLSAVDLLTKSNLKAKSGMGLQLAADAETFKINGIATVTCKDLVTTNATIHMVDNLLLTDAQKAILS